MYVNGWIYCLCTHTVLVYTICTGIYYMYWHILHVEAYTTCMGIYYMCWHILHVPVFTTCSGIVYVMLCILLKSDLAVREVTTVISSCLLQKPHNWPITYSQLCVRGRVCSREISWDAVSVIHCIHGCAHINEMITCV